MCVRVRIKRFRSLPFFSLFFLGPWFFLKHFFLAPRAPCRCTSLSIVGNETNECGRIVVREEVAPHCIKAFHQYLSGLPQVESRFCSVDISAITFRIPHFIIFIILCIIPILSLSLHVLISTSTLFILINCSSASTTTVPYSSRSCFHLHLARSLIIRF